MTEVDAVLTAKLNRNKIKSTLKKIVESSSTMKIRNILRKCLSFLSYRSFTVVMTDVDIILRANFTRNKFKSLLKILLNH